MLTKTLTTLATVATLAVAAVAAPSPADARGRGGAIAAGVIGGLAAGAIISGAASRPYGYYGGGPYYAAGACRWHRERFWDGFGWRIRRVRDCY